MKLLKCHIENFGKLSNFDYVFKSGLNTIKEENGFGKTTFARHATRFLGAVRFKRAAPVLFTVKALHTGNPADTSRSPAPCCSAYGVRRTERACSRSRTGCTSLRLPPSRIRRSPILLRTRA